MWTETREHLIYFSPYCTIVYDLTIDFIGSNRNIFQFNNSISFILCSKISCMDHLISHLMFFKRGQFTETCLECNSNYLYDMIIINLWSSIFVFLYLYYSIVYSLLCNEWLTNVWKFHRWDIVIHDIV